MRDILFRGFHEDENGKEKAFYNGKWHKGTWIEGKPMTEHMTLEEFRQMTSKPTNKFHAVKTKTEDGTFDSCGEAQRWGELKWLLKAGTISELERQKKIILTPRVHWRIDFTYKENGQTVYEDFKGHRGSDYIVKKNLLCDLIDCGKIKGIYRESTAQGVTEYPKI